jgi:hypothetical protein
MKLIDRLPPGKKKSGAFRNVAIASDQREPMIAIGVDSAGV